MSKIVNEGSLKDIQNLQNIYIDAGVNTVRVLACDEYNNKLFFSTIQSNENLQKQLDTLELKTLGDSADIFITGKLQNTLHKQIPRAKTILPSAALWAMANTLVKDKSVAILEISASGYFAIGVDPQKELHNDMLVINPRCGAGSGVNLDRVLQKLNIKPDKVDDILHSYIGEKNFHNRSEINIRADRCGVFASSATISDKNQGIPIDYALATTLKSEVQKACQKIQEPFESVWLCGGIFRWEFARDCAKDYLLSIGCSEVLYDEEEMFSLKGLCYLQEHIGTQNFSQPDKRVVQSSKLSKYSSMQSLKNSMSDDFLYRRLPNNIATSLEPLDETSVNIAMDVGSTMAKVVIADTKTSQLLYKGTYSNAGDTIETLKQVFLDLKSQGAQCLNISQIGITGSARFQVKKALENTYVELADHITLLVENYAHARGSIEYAKEHIAYLKQNGIEDVNEEFCVLIDIGGEDTKISSISLEKTELYDNAMNVKCSAGTGSLMDTLTSMFHLQDIAYGCDLAFNAQQGYAINATCAVFLMENARKLQAEGYSNAEILASANWAIVENMARTLWNQIEIPANCVALLHGQTMLSEPLPVAVAHRLQTFTNNNIYAIVPPDPGHRACVGLINSLEELQTSRSVVVELDQFIEKEYVKKIVQCKGAACGDALARCNRSHLTSTNADSDKKYSFSLGGCSAINELQAKGSQRTKGVKDTYKLIWEFIDNQLPSSQDAKRLVIPRSFALSEWAMFFSSLFTPLGIPVDVDNIQDTDILKAQPHFHIDTCAPHMGVVGQFLRIASQEYGMILAPQIEFLPVKGDSSLGRTCTINQGGFAVAKKIVEDKFDDANIHLFFVNLKMQDPQRLALKLYPQVKKVFEFYEVEVSYSQFVTLVANAIKEQNRLKKDAGDYAATLAEEAMQEGHEVAVVLGREYILTPGIYDSHVGRLLRDKNMVGIPSYLLDSDYNPEFKHLYWRNPHMIATLAAASAKKMLYKSVGHSQLRSVFQKVEQEQNKFLPIIQVSTFLCGPDSVLKPLVEEVTKQRPYLLIQSDAIIKELAHLENRMNTYVKQLDSGLFEALNSAKEEGFDVKVLSSLTSSTPIDAKHDVIYFPTLSDTRPLTALIRGAGFSCVDLYHDDFDLQNSIKSGRESSGDLVCAPLAAVYGDLLSAMEDFKNKKENDPAFKDKKRLLFFNNKGLGPCRQGQYVEMHKILLNQHKEQTSSNDDELFMQFLVGLENEGFGVGLPDWVTIRAIQVAILQGVLHQILAEGASQCQDFEEYQKFMEAFKKLREQMNDILEYKIAPGKFAVTLSQKLKKLKGLHLLANYFLFGLHSNTLTKPLKMFTKQWLSNPLPQNRIRIHIDGEAYMRVAQYEDVHKTLLATLGFREFELTHTPVWSFFDYKLAGMLMRAQEAVDESAQELKNDLSVSERKRIKTYKRKKQLRLKGLKLIHFILREILAKPLYRATGLAIPESVPKILDIAQDVISTKRPGGELVPYVGEAVLKLRKGYDLVLNVAPEGCMVSSMGEAITPGINNAAKNARGKVQHLFSQQGDVDEELMQSALLKTIGPIRFYTAAK
ncbi:BadF/BadG/BcrA/BcrD ATPase family protein [Sulfurimonas sp.]|uniref:BadF/BadG/BcrA/BcrD ATPase family protein n=1 Tax=Sulfurimonas sp. TaxID=2022749 RepID=UPI003D0F27A1